MTTRTPLQQAKRQDYLVRKAHAWWCNILRCACIDPDIWECWEIGREGLYCERCKRWDRKSNSYTNSDGITVANPASIIRVIKR